MKKCILRWVACFAVSVTAHAAVIAAAMLI